MAMSVLVKQEMRKQTKRHQSFLTLCMSHHQPGETIRALQSVFVEMNWLFDFITILEKNSTTDTVVQETPLYGRSSNEITAPALSVIVFLPEQVSSSSSSSKIQQIFERWPWFHHHTLQLQCSKSFTVIGQQRFYAISRQLPLWSICDSCFKSYVVRFSILTRRYHDMLEFYRLITNTEMESHKPGFCVFPLTYYHRYISTKSSVQCELALKYSPSVKPYTLSASYFTFYINDLDDLLRILPSEPYSRSSYHCLVRDPDGNTLLLWEVKAVDSSNSTLMTTQTEFDTLNKCVALGTDRTNGFSDSFDSGRFSEVEVMKAESNEQLSTTELYC